MQHQILPAPAPQQRELLLSETTIVNFASTMPPVLVFGAALERSDSETAYSSNRLEQTGSIVQVRL